MAADIERARKEATSLLVRYRIVKPPVDSGAIALAEGIEVFDARFPGISKRISGVFDFRTDRIILNRDIPEERRAFTVAHELGHALMYREYARSKDYRAMPYGNWWRDGKPDVDLEADAFAANLLVPLEMLRRWWSRASTRKHARTRGNLRRFGRCHPLSEQERLTPWRN